MVQAPIEEITSREEVLSHPDASQKCLLDLGELVNHHQRGWYPLSIDGTAQIPPKDRRRYYIQVRVMLGDGGGDQLTPSHACGECLIANILQEAWPEDQITKAMVLSPGETILFFGRCSRNEGLPYCRARNIEFGLGGPFNWARRSTQIEASRKIVQGCQHTIIEAVVEKKTKAREPGQPWGKAKYPTSPAAAYDIEEWIQGLEGISNGEPK